jgi:phosphomethylpyrimidine synthase
MDLSTGRNIHETRAVAAAQFAGADRNRADLRSAGKVGGDPAELSWEVYRDTLIEQAEQGVDYFTCTPACA